MKRPLFQAFGIAVAQYVALLAFLSLLHESGYRWVEPVANLLVLPLGLIGFAPGGWRQAHLQPVADAIGGVGVLIGVMALLNAVCWFLLLLLVARRRSGRDLPGYPTATA